MKQYKNMFVYSVLWQKEPSFRMFPLDDSCPFVDVIYDPIEKTLAVISKHRMLETEDTSERYYEHYITDPEEIIAFVNSVACNNTVDALTPIFNSLPEPK